MVKLMNENNKTDYILQHINSLLTRDSNQILLEQFGIGYSQYKILRIINNGLPVKQRFIVDMLGQTEASISRQVDILVKSNLITKVKDPNNKKVRLITITPKGKKLSDASSRALSKYHQSNINELSTKDQQDLLKILEKLHDKICINDHSTDIDYLTYLTHN